MSRTFVALGALWAGLAVMAGAFGAHALKSRLSEHHLSVFETAARYHMYLALALIGVGVSLATPALASRGVVVAGWLLFGGSVIFSGSLYLLALTGVGVLGAITPLGGALAIAGFLTWAICLFASR